jgi:hypothetical protein
MAEVASLCSSIWNAWLTRSMLCRASEASMVWKLCNSRSLVEEKTTTISASAPRQAAINVFLCNSKSSPRRREVSRCSADAHYVGSTPVESRLALRHVSPIGRIPCKSKVLAPLWSEFVRCGQLTELTPAHVTIIQGLAPGQARAQPACTQRSSFSTRATNVEGWISSASESLHKVVSVGWRIPRSI